MKIDFGPLVHADNDLLAQITALFDKGWITEGEQVDLFEREFAEKFGFRYAVMTSSGTTAGIVAWSALRELSKVKWGTGGRVITPASAFVATANAILHAGLLPAFVDVSLDTLNLKSEAPVPARYDVIGVQFVANMGKLEGIDYWRDWCERNQKPLLIDACEAHGARWNDQDISSLCDVAIYSFYTAHLVVAGEGGMICTNNRDIADLCRSIKSHGRPANDNYFSFDRIGFNAKSTDIAAAIGRSSLKRFDETFRKRRQVRSDMMTMLQGRYESIRLYPEAHNETLAPHAFPIVLRGETVNIRRLANAFDQAGIAWKTLFGCLPVQHAACGFLGHKWGEFPVAERLGRAGIHWGTHEGMTSDDVSLICETVSKAVDGR